MLTTATLKRRPTPPGEMLLEEFLRPAGITQVELAARMGVPIQRVNAVIAGRRAVTAETAILLSRALGTTPALWLNLQIAVDLWDAEHRLARARPAPHRTARSTRALPARR
jgi:addiction module HigA family antidote